MSKVKVNKQVSNGVAFGKVSDCVFVLTGEYYVIRHRHNGTSTHRDVASKHKAIKSLRDWLRYNR